MCIITEEADSIDVASIKILQNTSKSSDVLITWDEPPNPNGLIITYHLEYSNVNTPDVSTYKVYVH